MLSHIKAPVFAERTFLITDYGAQEGGKTKCTDAFAKAIAACHAAGGGTVSVPAGQYLTGPIHLRDNVCLDVKKGATVSFSTDFDDYLPAVLIRWEGVECHNLSPLIHADGCNNIGVIGEGTLHGNGSTWWAWRRQKEDYYRTANKLNRKWADENAPMEDRVQGEGNVHWCPTFIGLYNCKNVLLEGLTLIDGPFWNIHPVYCENVTVRAMSSRWRG